MHLTALLVPPCSLEREEVISTGKPCHYLPLSVSPECSGSPGRRYAVTKMLASQIMADAQNAVDSCKADKPFSSM